MENPFVAAYKRMFPLAQPNVFQLELIEFEIHDAAAWQETLIWWAGNDYRPQSVFKMIEKYKQTLTERMNRNVAANVGRYVPRPDEVSFDDCRTCDNTRRIGDDWRTAIRCPDCVMEKVA